MSWFVKVLSKTPESDASWHCPWFRLIEYFAGLGIVFGLLSYVQNGTILGLLALLIGLGSAAFTLGTRRKDSNSC